ncbi:hypothetical protein DVDV_2993 [Desulfovibrio sp. DV]|nr:hypothetical protein DVDV_2993 [Desulfovibrio sp. DV]
MRGRSPGLYGPARESRRPRNASVSIGQDGWTCPGASAFGVYLLPFQAWDKRSCPGKALVLDAASL